MNKQHPTGFQVEFWTAATGEPRRHRKRYYPSAENMLRAGARWEAKGSEYSCRYWNGLNTWTTAPRARVDAEPAEDDTVHLKRPSMQIFSIFGVCEAAAAEVMLKDGRATRKIPVEEIPEDVLFNELGTKARFAVMVPSRNVPAFDKLCKDMRA